MNSLCYFKMDFKIQFKISKWILCLSSVAWQRQCNPELKTTATRILNSTGSHLLTCEEINNPFTQILIVVQFKFSGRESKLVKIVTN